MQGGGDRTPVGKQPFERPRRKWILGEIVKMAVSRLCPMMSFGTRGVDHMKLVFSGFYK
jgi:hypothetical protein